MLGRLFGRAKSGGGLEMTTFDARDLDSYWNAVVGESFRQEQLKATLGELGREFTGILIREPNNAHDVNAVMVYSTQGHLGYLPREHAIEWAPVLDAVFQAGFKGLAVNAKIHGGEAGKPNIGCVVQLPSDCEELLAQL